MDCKTNFSVTLAAGALAFAGVLLATPATADDSADAPADTVVSTVAVVVDADVASRKRAARANRSAAAKAVDGVLADTRLDLDIRLIGPTSVKIASDR